MKHSEVANHEAKAGKDQGKKAKDGGTRRSGLEADLKASRAHESEQGGGSKGKRQQIEGEEAPKKKKKVTHNAFRPSMKPLRTAILTAKWIEMVTVMCSLTCRLFMCERRTN